MGCCVHGDEPSGYIVGGGIFFEQLSCFWPLNKVSAL